MFIRRSQRGELFSKYLDIGRQKRVNIMDHVDEEQLENIYTILNTNYERRFIPMENPLAIFHSNNNSNQRQYHKGK